MAFYALSRHKADPDRQWEEIDPLKVVTNNLWPSLIRNSTCQDQQVNGWTGVDFMWPLDAQMLMDYTYEYHSQASVEIYSQPISG